MCRLCRSPVPLLLRDTYSNPVIRDKAIVSVFRWPETLSIRTPADRMYLDGSFEKPRKPA